MLWAASAVYKRAILVFNNSFYNRHPLRKALYKRAILVFNSPSLRVCNLRWYAPRLWSMLISRCGSSGDGDKDKATCPIVRRKLISTQGWMAKLFVPSCLTSIMSMPNGPTYLFNNKADSIVVIVSETAFSIETSIYCDRYSNFVPSVASKLPVYVRLDVLKIDKPK